MAELRKDIENEKRALKATFEKEMEKLDQLEKYADIDFGDYIHFVSNLNVVVAVSEEQHKEAIAHFRKQFPRKADIRVSTLGGETFYVHAHFSEDFHLYWKTKVPENYLPKGCRVERETEERTRIVCGMEV